MIGDVSLEFHNLDSGSYTGFEIYWLHGMCEQFPLLGIESCITACTFVVYDNDN